METEEELANGLSNLYLHGTGKWDQAKRHGIQGFKQVDSLLVWGDLVLGVFFAKEIGPRPVWREFPSSFLALSHLCHFVTEKLLSELNQNEEEILFTLPAEMPSVPIAFRYSCDCQEKRLLLSEDRGELAKTLETWFFKRK
jgi:hypothetical protein